MRSKNAEAGRSSRARPPRVCACRGTTADPTTSARSAPAPVEMARRKRGRRTGTRVGSRTAMCRRDRRFTKSGRCRRRQQPPRAIRRRSRPDAFDRPSVATRISPPRRPRFLKTWMRWRAACFLVELLPEPVTRQGGRDQRTDEQRCGRAPQDAEGQEGACHDLDDAVDPDQGHRVVGERGHAFGEGSCHLLGGLHFAFGVLGRLEPARDEDGSQQWPSDATGDARRRHVSFLPVGDTTDVVGARLRVTYPSGAGSCGTAGARVVPGCVHRSGDQRLLASRRSTPWTNTSTAPRDPGIAEGASARTDHPRPSIALRTASTALATASGSAASEPARSS